MHWTYLKLALGDDADKLSSHSGNEVFDKHYIDKKVVYKAVAELKVLG
ncbi:hypothetical protein L0P88_20050 [Muricauda sp. SCSIO 64092]|nr:hypothetical protein [Muricauda sp. SCSIO 64092]UOY06204.1 hypothetical protein L0P88_20050 [Muricauda sp. SCSIO 64092]